MEYHSSISKDEVLSFLTKWIELEISKLERNKPDPESQVPHDLTHV
jgi:hypothetical protein